ncbi:hypothetical protein M0Q97_05345 [Candidatus Dojkabacteria bacterium]|jgi:hypothetical protein|nr:hypothetical protein [Candidatus Dojkabacteria bacterium]
MAKIDFITLSNIIFKNKEKEKYQYVSDEEKEANFFMLNRKFAIKYLKQAQFFNNRNVDKSSAIDIWYKIFKNTTYDTPSWWWKSKQTKNKPKSEFASSDLKLIKDYYELTNGDIKFLITYYKDILKDDIKRLKKFDDGKK